jgi:anti-sigma B factor antagonist
MNYKKKVLDQILLITIEISEAGLNQSEEFKNYLLDNSATDNPKIIIDMAKVLYMDSSFIGALVVGLKRVLSKNGEMVLINIQNDVLALFELTRLDQVFKIYESLEEAQKRLN